MEKIKIIQENYEKIIEVAKLSYSKRELLKNLGYLSNKYNNKLNELLEYNNFDFNILPYLKRKEKHVFSNKERLEKVIKESFSYSEVCKAFKLNCTSDIFSNLKAYIKLFNLDINHFNHARTYYKDNFSKGYTKEDLFKENSLASTTTVKNRILKDNLKEYKCVECGNKGMWQGKKISLQLDHINGDNKDHRLENLCFLCPNCHAITETWCAKNVKKKMFLENDIGIKRSTESSRLIEKNKDLILNEYVVKCNSLTEILVELGLENKNRSYKILNNFLEMNRTSEVNNFLEMINKKVVYPELRVLKKLVKEKSFLQVGKELGCSDNAIRKHIESHKKKLMNYPEIDELKKAVEEKGFVQVGRELGCSDNSIRKHLRKHGINLKTGNKIKM